MLGEVVRQNEGLEVGGEAGECPILEGFDRCLLERAVHSLSLSSGLGMI